MHRPTRWIALHIAAAVGAALRLLGHHEADGRHGRCPQPDGRCAVVLDAGRTLAGARGRGAGSRAALRSAGRCGRAVARSCHGRGSRHPHRVWPDRPRHDFANRAACTPPDRRAAPLARRADRQPHWPFNSPAQRAHRPPRAEGHAPKGCSPSCQPTHPSRSSPARRRDSARSLPDNSRRVDTAWS